MRTVAVEGPYRALRILAVAATLLLGSAVPHVAGEPVPTQDAPPTADGGAPSDTVASLSPAAAAYLTEALAIIRDNAYWSDSVEWTGLRAAVFDSAAGARVPADTYESIRFALASLGDHHSFLQLSRELRDLEIERLRTRGLLEEAATAARSRAPAVSPCRSSQIGSTGSCAS